MQFLVIAAVFLCSCEPRTPLLGYVRVAGGELRPVTGFVGANVVEDRLETSGAVFAAPGNRYALVETASGIGVARLDAGGLGPARLIEGTAAGLERAIFSPGGGSAIIPALAAGRLQVITGLPEQARVIRQLDIPAMSGAFLGAAVSEDGEVLLAAFAAGEAARLEETRVGADQWRTVLERQSIAAVRFVGASHTALAADAAANEIVLLDKGGAAVLAGPEQGVNGPVDLETAAGGRRILVANSGGNVLEIDRDNGKTRVITCGFAPHSFQRMMGSAVAVLGRDGTSVAVIDGEAETPWAAFAPRVQR